MLKLATKFLPRRAAFETAYLAGFRHAEFWLSADLLARHEEIASLAKHYPLSYALHFPNDGVLGSESLEQAAALYRSLDCRVMAIHQPPFDRYGAKLCEIEPSIRLAVENPELSPPQFHQWAQRRPWLTLDVEHYWKYTLDDAPLDELLAGIQEFMDRFGDKLLHVHMGGYLPGGEEHRPMYCSREFVFRMFSLLAQRDYDGFIVGESDAPYQNVYELRMDALLFEAWRQRYDGDWSAVERSVGADAGAADAPAGGR